MERVIRRAGPGDLDAIETLEGLSFSVPWSRSMLAGELQPDPSRLPLLALVDAQPVGFALAWEVADEIHLVSLAVDPVHRRQGIGRALLEALLQSPEAARASLMTLEVRMNNRAALELYHRYGFRQVAIRPRYYPDTQEDALVMIKELRAAPPHAGPVAPTPG